MENYQIKYLDCTKVQNRMLLLKEVKKVIKADEKPSKERLHKIVKSLQKKYGIKIRLFKQKNSLLFCSLEVERGTYSTLCCNSLYEFMCKYILLCKNEAERRKKSC